MVFFQVVFFWCEYVHCKLRWKNSTAFSSLRRTFILREVPRGSLPFEPSSKRQVSTLTRAYIHSKFIQIVISTGGDFVLWLKQNDSNTILSSDIWQNTWKTIFLRPWKNCSKRKTKNKITRKRKSSTILRKEILLSFHPFH